MLFLQLQICPNRTVLYHCIKKIYSPDSHNLLLLALFFLKSCLNHSSLFSLLYLLPFAMPQHLYSPFHFKRPVSIHKSIPSCFLSFWRRCIVCVCADQRARSEKRYSMCMWIHITHTRDEKIFSNEHTQYVFCLIWETHLTPWSRATLILSVACKCVCAIVLTTHNSHTTWKCGQNR